MASAMASVRAPKGLSNRTVSSNKTTLRVTIVRGGTSSAANVRRARFGSRRSALIPAQSFSTKTWATRQPLPAVKSAKVGSISRVGVPTDRSAPSSGEPCRTSTSSKRTQVRSRRQAEAIPRPDALARIPAKASTPIDHPAGMPGRGIPLCVRVEEPEP